jgi:hypothetical protein
MNELSTERKIFDFYSLLYKSKEILESVKEINDGNEYISKINNEDKIILLEIAILSLNLIYKPKNLVLERPKENKENNIKSESYQFVYIAKHDQYYKIGRTVNIEKRIAAMKTGNPIIEIIMTRRTENNIELEKYFHALFKGKQYKREWFLLNHDDLKMLVGIFGFNYEIQDNSEAIG